MTRVNAGITTSVMATSAGRTMAPGKGSAREGSASTTGSSEDRGRTSLRPEGEATGEGAAWLAAAMARLGAVVGGRWTYEASGHWGGTNPFGLPMFHCHASSAGAAGRAFTFVDGVDKAVARARDAAGQKDVHIMGGADVIRQALEADLVDELTIIVAPVVLGSGKRLFDGFTKQLELEHLGVRQSPYATLIDYRVVT